MIVYYLSSLAPVTKSIVTTRHFSPIDAECEKLRRLQLGHGHFSMQQVVAAPQPSDTATKPKRGGGHAQA